MLAFDNRHIAHLDLDTFFVSVEHLRNPKLVGKPVLIGGSNARGVVASCSREARQFGIHSGMPMYQAVNLCRESIIIKSDFEAYSKASSLVTDIVRDSVPAFEKASIDEFYIDLTGMDKYYGCYKFTGELQQKVNKESGLPVSWAVASNKLISKVATNEVKPKGQIEIPFGLERSYLAPLTVLKLPGVGRETGFKFLKMGVETIAKLSEMPMEFLINFMGKNGHELWRRANGIDESPVVPYSEQVSISTEQTFQTDTIDINALEAILVRMTESVAYELRSQNRLAGCITVKIRYTDFQTYTKQKVIPYTNGDHVLIKTVKELFTRLYDRRVLVRLLGVRLSHLTSGTYQINLFEDTQEMIRLYQSIDSIKKQFGEDKIVRAKTIYLPGKNK